MIKRLAQRAGRLTAALAVAIALLQPASAYADVPYLTFYKDQYDQQYQMQTAYRPAGALGRELFIADPGAPDQQLHSPLNQPQDLYIDDKDEIYIADTGNNRIVHLNPHGELIRILDFPEDPLNRPQGLFIHDNGDLYIADTGNNRVVRASSQGEVLRTFQRPESKLIPDAFKYDPVKLVVDKRGFLYIATLGGYQGLLQLDPQGEFQGFFGANQTSISFVDSVKRLIYTREMYEREISKLPGSITSVDQGGEGFIYTVTREVQTGQLKKLNIAGLDQLSGKGEFSDSLGGGSYGETIHDPSVVRQVQPQLNDLTVDSDGNITVVDSRLNVVSQYDDNGNLLFFWGGAAGDTTTKLGLVKTPSAIANDSNNDLYILDSENNVVQKYEVTEFGALVHQANRLTQDGRYEESEPLWQEVYRQNAYYAPAVLGLAKASYKRGDYDGAQRLFAATGWAQGFSDSFWQNRLQWFQSQFGSFMNAGLILVVGGLVIRRTSRRLGWSGRLREFRQGITGLPAQLGFVSHLVKQPLDAFYGIRHEGKASSLSGSLILLLALASYGYFRSGTNFIYNPAIIVDPSVATPLIQFSVVWLGFVLASYLVGSLNQGEGRFRDVYTASAYAMFPFILVGVPLTLLSGVMTLNESAIYHFLAYALYGWTGLLLFWKVQGVQNFSVGETVKHLVLTVLTMFIMAILIFITFSLTSELVSFVYSIYQEVAIR
ncbi:YIP1 family protein [Paenibacillus daejeonensis]|uniref:YIP1 family protein n=1 Tax=Paenibacillus daejeonensis TaxID=135193 RepID=UPI0003780FDB|nr:YIP1 family protein [Paenibacillus daejeonensis]